MEIKRNFDLLTNLKININKPIAISGKRHGKWTNYSTNEYVDYVNNISYGLLQLGIQPQDKVAIISTNRPEWNFADFGASQVGAVTVPMYPTIGEADYKHILNDSQAKIIFVETEEIYKKVANVRAEVPSIQEIYSFENIAGVKHYSELLELGKKNPNIEQVEIIKSKIDAHDLMTLIYTSGTTGTPKGVMLSHNNILSNVRGARLVCPFDETKKVLSFLPLCHVFERMVCYLYHDRGCSIYYAESMDTIGDNLKEIQPHAFSTVPRLLEKVYDKIMAKGYELSGIKKALFFWAVEVGHQFELHNRSAWYNFKLKIANKLIFSKWREALGGNVELIVSGAAALQPRLARVFTAAQIQVLEGYGLTETSPVICVNHLEFENRMFGTVGPTLDGVSIKIAEDGEIITKGPHVMLGYYNLPEATKEAIDSEGWFHTGDIGEIIDGKFLKITDRKKEVFKTSGGKYIAPQPMENKFKESMFIEQIMVIGENEKFPAALIVPAWDYIKSWCDKKGIKWTDDKAEMANKPEIIARFNKEVSRYNESFGNWEKIKKFELVPGDWGIESGEMTPTLKLKRKPILQKYNALVEKIYREA